LYVFVNQEGAVATCAFGANFDELCVRLICEPYIFVAETSKTQEKIDCDTDMCFMETPPFVDV